MPSYLTQTLDEFTDGGLLTLTDDVSGMRRCRLTGAGSIRYAQLTRCPSPDPMPGAAGPLAPAIRGGGACRALVLCDRRLMVTPTGGSCIAAG
jgi:hypothetical protein